MCTLFLKAEIKSSKINKERGPVYNDFDFDSTSTELLSECSSSITYSQTLVQDTNDVFSLNSYALVPQMSIDHAVLEANKNNEPVFYNTLAFDNLDYNISSSTPDKEYLKKCTHLQLDDIRISTVVKNCLIYMKCNKETIVRVLIASMIVGFYQTICLVSLQEVYNYVSRMGTPKVTYIQQKKI